MFCSTAWTSLHRIRTRVEFCHRATLDSVIARRRRLSGHKTNIDISFLLLLTVLFMFTPTSNSIILQYISILNRFWLHNCNHNCQQSWTKYLKHQWQCLFLLWHTVSRHKYQSTCMAMTWLGPITSGYTSFHWLHSNWPDLINHSQPMT